MAKNKRDCPALGEAIASARCGEERGSVIVCPGECEFNPFGRQNYAHFAEIEGRVIEKLMLRHLEVAELAEKERLARALGRHGKDVFLAHREFAKVYHEEVDAEGRTLIARWEAAGLAGLKNDERQLLRWMAATRLCLIEIHRQLDEYTVEVVDLFDADAQPFLIVDRSLAGRWVRFATLLCWCYGTPHYQRLVGGAREVREVGSLPPAKAIDAIVAHLNGPAVLADARKWITENIVQVVESLDASMTAAREAMLSSMDARFGEARFNWAQPAARLVVEKKLRDAPDIEVDELTDQDAARGWEICFGVLEPRVAEPVQSPSEQVPTIPSASGRVVLGSFLVGPPGMLVRAGTGTNFAELKHRVETLAGGSVVFGSEQVDDLAARLRKQEDLDYDAALVPPIFLAKPTQIILSKRRLPAGERGEGKMGSDYLQEHYRTFADHPLPALGGRTARQAATDPALRPALLDLMKTHLASLDCKSQEEQQLFDFDWLLRDLGLEEILFPPPPLRERPAVPDEDEEEEEELFADDEPEPVFDEDEWNYDPTLVELPAPGRVLSEEDVLERAGKFMGLTPAQVKEHVRASFDAWPGVTEICGAVAEAMTEDEISCLVFLFLQIAWLLHPVPPAGARLHSGRLLHYFDLEFNALITLRDRHSRAPDFEAFLGGTAQPAVVTWMVSMVLNELRTVGERGRMEPAMRSVGAIFTSVCLLRAAVRELCHWPVK